MQSPKPERKFYLDLARTVAILSITLNHAVNRSYRIHFQQQLQRPRRCR